MTVNKLVKVAHEGAMNKGFHDKKVEMGTLLALIHSEVSEALEAHRSGKMMSEEHVGTLQHFIDDPVDEIESTGGIDWFENNVKETFEMELADIVIRVADLCGLYGIDLESCIIAKIRYNSTRAYKHGKEY